MANNLKMATIHTIQGLLLQGWSYRRIGRELGIHRQTVSRYHRILKEAESKSAVSTAGSINIFDPKPAISTPGSGPPGRLSHCRTYRDIILKKLDKGLQSVRIHQDLVGEHGFTGSYSSVKRFVRSLKTVIPLPFRRIETGPGEEAQIDFGQAAFTYKDGKKRRPHLLRAVLSFSRKSYSEAIWHQTTEEFIRCLENAFRAFGGVPLRLVIDNLKAAVKNADWFDPELNPKIRAFCRHYGIVILPTRPRMPHHKGKIESGVKYVQNNALKGRSFDDLSSQNAFLRDWESSVADTRIHGTTKKQVRSLFLEEKALLKQLPTAAFPFFHEARRKVHRDGHIEVQKSYYSVPPEYLGHHVWVRWDSRVVRVYNDRFEKIATHTRAVPGKFSTFDGHIPTRKISSIERGSDYLVYKASRIGESSGLWAKELLKTRGIEGLRPLQGLLSLTRKYSAGAIDQAAKEALKIRSFRVKTLRLLCERRQSSQNESSLTQHHPIIRPLSEYQDLFKASVSTHVSKKKEEEQHMNCDQKNTGFDITQTKNVSYKQNKRPVF
jgi:transposase